MLAEPEDLREATRRLGREAAKRLEEPSVSEGGVIAGIIGGAVARSREKGRKIGKDIYEKGKDQDRAEMAREQYGRFLKVRLKLAKLIEESEKSARIAGTNADELLGWKGVLEPIKELADAGIIGLNVTPNWENFLAAEQLLESLEDMMDIKNDADNTAALLGGNGKASGIMGWLQKLPGKAGDKIKNLPGWGWDKVKTIGSLGFASLIVGTAALAFYLPVWLIDKVEKDVKLK